MSWWRRWLGRFLDRRSGAGCVFGSGWEDGESVAVVQFGGNVNPVDCRIANVREEGHSEAFGRVIDRKGSKWKKNWNDVWVGQIGGAICGSVSNGSVDPIYSIATSISTT